MTSEAKKGEERSCNCRNSKCMKLYCECYSARVSCGKSCHCLDCQNKPGRDIFRDALPQEKRITRDQLMRAHKGCACKRSGCTKKYCQCFQAGLLCRQSCKCVDCQNNQSLTNRRVINLLRRNNSDVSNGQNSLSLYPLYLSQNSQHLNSIIAESNPLGLEDSWLEHCAQGLYGAGQLGEFGHVMDKLTEILTELETRLSEQLGLQADDQSQEIEAENNSSKNMQPVSGAKKLQEEQDDHQYYENRLASGRQKDQEAGLKEQSSQENGMQDESQADGRQDNVEITPRTPQKMKKQQQQD